MSLFQPNDYSKYISEELATIIRRFSDTNDLKKVSENTGVSVSGINAVIYRKTKLTDWTAPAMIELMKIVNRKALEMKSFADLAVEKTKISD